MKTALIVDLETTGLDPEKDRVIEVGMVVYSIEHQTTLRQFSTLLRSDGNPAESVNRIPASALADATDAHAESYLRGEVGLIDCLVSHRAAFDSKWVRDFGKPWLCTMEDFKWPRATRDGQSLVSLALDHGIGVSSAHRALTDCQLIAALFDRMDDLPAMFSHAMRPKSLFRAMVSYDDRELAKAAGFRWDAVSKEWTRSMAIEDATKLPFRVVEVK
jgi:DNA polymerase-3 subunit epsilon